MKTALAKVLFFFVFFYSFFFVLHPFSTWAQSPQVKPPSQDQFRQNPHHSDKKTPAKYKPVNLQKTRPIVKKKFEDIDGKVQKLCSVNQKVYRLDPSLSSLKITTFKNWKVPVYGIFKSFDGYLTFDVINHKSHSSLYIDTGSWDSGTPDRDSRVMRYLLKANKKKYAYARLDMKPAETFSLTTSGVKPIKGKLQFRGSHYDIKTKTNALKKSGLWQLQSIEPLRFRAKIPDKDMHKIMKFCNHQSLSSTVDLQWDLVFKLACEDM